MKKQASSFLPESLLKRFFHELAQVIRGMPEPMAERLAHEYHHDPFIILISCLLSLRSRDVVTYKVAKKLFAYARTPEQLLALPPTLLATILHPIGFHYKKAAVLYRVSRELLDRFNGQVPSDEEALLSLYGVGRKTANLVRAEAFGIPSLAVDTHVHRLANQLGLVHTKTPEQTEFALKEKIPAPYWLLLHRGLVTCGQQRCSIASLQKILSEYYKKCT